MILSLRNGSEFYGRNYIFKNPISCLWSLNVAASSDSVVQTAKPAKMKQPHAVAAVLLLFPNFALTQERFLYTSLNIQAMNVANSPDGMLAVGDRAFNLIDGMCGQVPDGSPADFTVSGAYNMATGDFMTWSRYINTIGLYHGNPLFNWAGGPWHTFTGTCSLKPASAWVENGYRSDGSWVHNTGDPTRPRATRVSTINIRLPGFTVKTETTSWRSRCENINQMADTFRAMPEIPNGIKRIWKGLELREESTHVHKKPIAVPHALEAQAVAITNVLVMHAQLVLNVERYYWYYEPALSGVDAGWLGMGGLWNNIYADPAWVEARGLVEVRPRDLFPTRAYPPWWYCVTIDENTIFRPYVPPP